MNSYHESRNTLKWEILPFGLAITLAMVFYTFPVQAEELSPEFRNPSATWLIEIGSPIVWICLFVYFLRQSIRAGTLTFGLLFFISATSMWWQEWYQDWGGYLLYNPKFKLIPWGRTLWTSENKPWWMIASYGWYHTAVVFAILGIITRLRARLPKLGRTAAVIIVVFPIFYLWNVLVEGSSSANGWWSYVLYFGPAIVSSRGNYPLLYPVGFYAVYGTIYVWFLTMRGPDGRVKWESWFGVGGIRNRVWREAARIGVWMLMMNVIAAVFLTTPFIVIRELIIGVPSTLVP